MSQSLHLQIDDRERNPDLHAALKEIKGLVIESLRLDVGDFLIDNSVIIERKTAQDFAASLIDGRIFAQASKIVRSPFRPAYIIEGTSADWRKLKVTRPALQGALISLMLIFDIPVFRSKCPKETANLLCYIGRQLVRARCDGIIPVRQIKAKRKSTRKCRILQSLPGVGPDRAKRLLQHFGSVRACLSAEESDLTMVEGIGPNTARKIIETVEDPKTFYNSIALPQEATNVGLTTKDLPIF